MKAKPAPVALGSVAQPEGQHVPKDVAARLVGYARDMAVRRPIDRG